MSSAPGTDAAVHRRVSSSDPVRVVCVDDDPDQLALLGDGLSRLDRLRVATVDGPDAALDALADVDCVVSDFEMPGTDGLELLAAVRERRPSLPFVLWTNAPFDAVADRLLSRPLTDYVEKSGRTERLALLGHRVCRLADHYRARLLSDRLRAVVDCSDAAVLVADAEGRLAHASGAVADLLGYRPRELLGREWRSLFTDEATERLDDDAVPSLADGWRWTGTCTLRTADGEARPLRTDAVGLDGGGIVFAVRPRDS